ncbi:hypothetical protein PIB30_007107 [Stylosanthes scabra]|uniref:Uncharacterized protein n=1 Tax=Stylosanthes scabra TaxID=79078 RepID=A0ABU6S4E8_9FABA|nr:hypothetical protein [Stylosanthes scabra]
MAPCCENMGLKKGPWTAEEDQILISFIHRYGHGNWRALPKQAGLLRCGKSCRLRWINYLRPDIKRGKFSKEEEDTILKLHAVLGNRWSAIAARLQGRTDNEVKNFWHTHLKKRIEKSEVHNNGIRSKYSYPSQIITMPRVVAAAIAPSSSSSSAASSFNGKKVVIANDGLSSTSRNNRSSSSPNIIAGPRFCSAISSSSDDTTTTSGETMGNQNHDSIQLTEEMEFWYNIFIKSGQL